MASVTFDSFLIEVLLLKFADNIVLMLYNVVSVVPSACQLWADDNDPSVKLTTWVVCPASAQNVHIH